MSYTALYRKFRPDTFSDVKGQDAIVKTLANQIKTGRVGHAYLFCGTRGTGKTSVAKIFARAINCENPVNGNPCNKCAVCKAIQQGTSMNVMEIDAASNNGVDSIRQIVEEVKYSPTEGSYRVYIIDEVHMLSAGAFNALLKTLEEPPSYVVFILATTEAHKIPITILSRCQRYDFKRISIDTITDRLEELCNKEGISAERTALKYIAKCGEGSLRDSLSLLERCIAFYFEEELTYDKVLDILGSTDVETFSILLRYIHKGSVDECMRIVEELVTAGRDLPRFIVDFTWYMRNLLLAGTGRDISDLLEVSSEQMQLLIHESKVFTADELMHYIGACSELTNRIRYATQKRVLIETELIKMCHPQMEDNLEALTDRVRRLESKLEELAKGGIVIASGDSGSEGKNPVEGGGAESREEEYKYLPKALPEDIKEVAVKWREIISGASTMLVRNILAGATPSVSPEGRLLLVFETGIDYNMMKQDGREEELQKLIAAETGKQVEVNLVLNEAEKGKEKYFDITEFAEKFKGIPIEIV
ncbi:MAG: DNA polymerase III subunit gamma/tau [Lachnospiraceae bacterium]